MKKIVELPIVEPVYSTYHHQGVGAAAIHANPSIRHWYLNQSINLSCNTKFMFGFTSPEIRVEDVTFRLNPHLVKKEFDMQFLKGYVNPVIRELLDRDYYVIFTKVDDYYVEGKSWYHEKHNSHDGLICGYNQEEKTYSIHAYDSRWIYRVFQTPQKAFDAGRKAMFRQGEYGIICGIKPKPEFVALEPETICRKLRKYLDSSIEKYPVKEEGKVFGIAVQDYIGMYVDKLFDGSIPYERMDRRVFRLIWEHKKVMHERLAKTENLLLLDSELSRAYEKLVSEANAIRMLYASHNMKRRDSVLPTIRKKLLWIKDAEQDILSTFVERAEGAISK